MKTGFWRRDWIVGLVVALLFLLAAPSAPMQGLERDVYDWGVRLSAREPGDRVAVIAIDDESIANLGRWPWPRDIHASLIDLLAQGGAKMVGETVFFLEPQIDPGLSYINDLIGFVDGSSLLQAVPGDVQGLRQRLEAVTTVAAKRRSRSVRKAADAALSYLDQSALTGRIQSDTAALVERLTSAESALNTDRILAQAIAQAGNVVLAMPFILGEPQGNPDAALPEYVRRDGLLNVDDRIGAAEQGLFPPTTVAGIPPIPELGEPAAGIGHLNASPDVDGAIRNEPLVLLHYDTYIPSLALQLAAHSLNLRPDDIQVHLGEGVRLGRLWITTDGQLRMNTFFYGDVQGRPAFPVDSFFDVISGKIPPSKYRDKIVLVGATATGVGTPQVTPISAAMPPVVTLAHSVASILNEDFFVAPEWALWAQIGAFLLVAIYLIVLLPRLKAGTAAVITVVMFVGLLGTQLGLMVSQALWVPLVLSASLLAAGHLVLTTKRFLVTERGKEQSEAESAESNRMLGLAFQGQGQLDMAFEKFRKVPLDDSVMDLLYNLGLDFERKRQFNKAGAVYSYMSGYKPKFRDIADRMARTRAMEETVMLGGVRPNTAAGTLIMGSAGIQKPMLGRYEVEKELGKGAMGVVYLGKDPKINRVVAIKTMALSQEFEEDELEEVKERFFREAETAGRLTHPNIVTIFDAGEEHDLAYIAMEFLKGKDLTPYTKEGQLLPLRTTLDLAAQAADALGYAHSQNVVHRDVKPANLMYEPESGAMKITDFGIARITDSSKTKTGMVLGTPSYMSPEQLAGKKVDGRSDLFSLGVMLYQLLTGTLPFQGDSMATLMYKIANEAHPDILSLRADLPACVKAILDQALEKDIDRRYQNGMEMARDLRNCATQLG